MRFSLFRVALALVCTPMVCGAQKATAPKVVFLGDYFTYAWGLPANSNAFQANPKWINRGLTGRQDSYQMLARFQSDVVSEHPAVVAILAGAIDVGYADDANRNLLVQEFEANISAMVAEAEHANIKVILGTVPPLLVGGPSSGQPQFWMAFQPTLTLEANAWIESYASANKIPVVNYHDLLCQCVGSTNPNLSGYYPLFTQGGVIPTPAGYAAMTQLMQTAIRTLTLTLDSGSLTNAGNLHTVGQGAVVPFTAWGLYSDGIPRPLLNTSFEGMTGTWSSDNLYTLYVGYDGVAYALAPGQANVWFTSPSGLRFSPWPITVEPRH